MATDSNLILAVNSGSSSLKFGLYRTPQQSCDPALVLAGGASGIGHPNGRLQITDAAGKTLVDEAYKLASQGEAMREILDAIAHHAGQKPDAVGHRMVHGGPHLREHQLITPALLRTLEAATQFAPIHIPAALKLLRETEKLLPGIPQYACFDTAFHRTMPERSRHFPLPERLYDLGVERFGFHGLSYESMVARLAPAIPERVVGAHLGSGASLVALRKGVSIDTSMGMTPVGGIPMATRSGDFDPGVVLFLMRTEQLSADALESLLNHDSGLGALSGGESDMRLIEQCAEKGDAKAQLALDVFAHGARKMIGAYAAELGGLDLLVFTGGIGEHDASMRNRICQGLDFLGLTSGDPAQCAKVRVMPAQEELQIARITCRLHESA
ncbi:MAG TPA: acetate/propionate family kinase [Acidobacteriaceae bacterium]|nr:acetate/propionate family kinase [Acidobacteriaceae bacterium]